MSDNNADFNGAGQVNNPTSDNAAQADYNQPYIPQQNDAQMNHPESQPETPAYDQNSAAYTQPVRLVVIRLGVSVVSRLSPAGSAGHARCSGI